MRITPPLTPPPLTYCRNPNKPGGLDKSRDEIALEVDEDVESFKDTYLNHLVTWYESAERNPEAIFSKPFAEDLSVCMSIADSMSKSN